jgi:hypothetical protein
MGLRVASAVAVLIYAFGICVVLRCAEFNVRWISVGFARVAAWIFGVGLLLSGLGNIASQSDWERLLMAPIGLLLGVLCLVVARRSRDRQVATTVPPAKARMAA